MKKLFASILVLIVLFSLVGCGSKDDAKINGELLVALIEGEWYKFLPKSVTAITE